MNTLELFSGTKSFSKVAEYLGHKTLTIDNNVNLNPDICADILQLTIKELSALPKPDIIWASPPCTAFSVASLGKHWYKSQSNIPYPKTPSAELGLKLLEKTIEIIAYLKPEYWFIENPRGKMRKYIDIYFKKYKIYVYKRAFVTYCKYGDTRQKPTDIWTNRINWYPKKSCKSGDNCHDRQPRGYRAKKAFNCLGKGTQGLKGATERGRIPEALFMEIFRTIGGKK